MYIFSSNERFFGLILWNSIWIFICCSLNDKNYKVELIFRYTIIVVIIVWFKNWLLWKAHNSVKRKENKQKRIISISLWKFDGWLVDQMKRNFNDFWEFLYFSLIHIQKENELRLLSEWVERQNAITVLIIIKCASNVTWHLLENNDCILLSW